MTELPARFWAKVDKSGGPDACWLWTACRGSDGYGQFGLTKSRKRVSAHRLAYTDAFGPIPDGMEVDHICHTRHCVKPAHLRLATHGQNQQNRQGPTTRSISGVRGVSPGRNNKGWRARIQLNGKSYQATFPTIEEAEQAVRTLRDQLFTHHIDGAKAS